VFNGPVKKLLVPGGRLISNQLEVFLFLWSQLDEVIHSGTQVEFRVGSNRQLVC
jgi:hypothetical protein